MRTKANPRFDELLAALLDQAEGLLQPWEGDCWRFQAITHPRGREILSGDGARLHGGRWNAPAGFPVIYGSTTGAVALAESEANDRYYGIITRKARIYVCIGLKLARVLDLTDTATLRRLKLVAKHLRAEDWKKINAEGHESLTQCIGRTALAAGAEALITSSASVRGGINLACFPGNKRTGSAVILHDEAAIVSMLKMGDG